MKHIVRIEPPMLRIPLLCLFFPLDWLLYIMFSLLPKTLGGHPNKNRLLELDFYTAPWALFWAAWDGDFVPTSERS